MNEIKINALYKHYKDGYFRVVMLAKTESDKQDVIVYTSLNTGSTYTMPVSEFFADVSEREDNKSGQSLCFELASSVIGLLPFAYTSELVEELNNRPDNPYSGQLSNDEKENIWSSEYLLGRVIEHPETDTESSYEEFLPYTSRTFETLDDAKRYLHTFNLTSNVVIARRVIRKINIIE